MWFVFISNIEQIELVPFSEKNTSVALNNNATTNNISQEEQETINYNFDILRSKCICAA